MNHRRSNEFRSAVCSEVLPLVEFYLEDDISDEEAVSLIDLEVPRVEINSSGQEMSSGGNVSFTLLPPTGILVSYLKVSFYFSMISYFCVLNFIFKTLIYI